MSACAYASSAVFVHTACFPVHGRNHWWHGHMTDLIDRRQNAGEIVIVCKVKVFCGHLTANLVLPFCNSNYFKLI